MQPDWLAEGARLLDRISRLGPGEVADALPRLTVPALWDALMPGTDRRQCLALLGDDPVPALEAALHASGDVWQALRVAGLDLETDGDIPFGLLARRLSAPEEAPGPALPCLARVEWERRARACVDEAAGMLASGDRTSPLDALVTSASGGLSEVLGIAPFGARERVAYGLAAAGRDTATFAAGYLRRSAVATLLHAIHERLSPPGHPASRSDETGWPMPDGPLPGTREAPACGDEPTVPATLLLLPHEAAALVSDWPGRFGLVLKQGNPATWRLHSASGAARLPPDAAWPPATWPAAVPDFADEIALLAGIPSASAAWDAVDALEASELLTEAAGLPDW